MNTPAFQLSPDPPPKRGIRFIPPTAEEVAEYAAAEKLPNHAACFCDHFDSNGWRVGGKAPMANWRAAYRNWCRRAPAFQVPNASAAPNSPAAQHAREYREACTRGDDRAKDEVRARARVAGIDWETLRAEITRQNEKERNDEHA